MHKKYWIGIVITGLLLVLLYLHFVPYHPFKDPDAFAIDSVKQVLDGNGDEEDITDQIDLEKLQQYLLLMKTKRLRKHEVRHVTADVTYYIDGIYENRPMHIILGPAEENWVYESADRGGYAIENPEIWLRIMEDVKKEETA